MKNYLVVSISVNDDGTYQIENDVVKAEGKYDAMIKYKNMEDHDRSLIVNIVCVSD